MAGLNLLTPSGGYINLSPTNTATNVTLNLPTSNGSLVSANTGSGTFTTSNFNSASSFGFKNRIINGGMVIDQRNAGGSVTYPSGTEAYTVDRFKVNGTASSKATAQQSSTAPTGFTNSLLTTSSSAYSVTSGDYFVIRQHVEGYNVSDFGWGSSGASTVTLSFWVRSSLTGTFGGSFVNSAQDRSYPFSYTISSANTWEQKVITVAGDTTGTWLKTTGTGIQIFWSVGVGSTYSGGTAGVWGNGLIMCPSGSTSVVGTNGATFYITGVQFEVGSVATPFDFRSYGQELALCQRYYENNYPSGSAAGASVSNANVYSQTIATINATLTGSIMYRVPKRATPTVNFWSFGGSSGQWHYGRQGATETLYTPTNFSINQNSITWWNSSIPTSQDVHYGMYAVSAEL